MKRLKAGVAVILTAVCLLLPSCSLPFGNAKRQNSTLKIGVAETAGNFNPFYCGENDDSVIMSQLFERVQRRGVSNKFENYCGSITYEFLESGKVKYTVSIDDNIRFSDGTYATIDDVIFWYYVLADATYDGAYSDWYLNDIQGLKAFYYDDKNYEKKLAEIDEKYTDPAEREEKVKEYIDKNYSNGTSVSEISGIKKINDHTCTVVFNSVNVGAISQINPLIVSKAAYGAGYVKGKAETVKSNAEKPVGSGAYKLDSSDKKSGLTVLSSNEYYRGGKNGFDTLNVIDLSVKKLSPESAVSRGAVDILETTAKNAIVSTAENAGYKYNFCDDTFYNSIIFNCAKIDINIRKGIMCLANWNGEAKDEFGGYYTAVYRPMSVRFGEYPASTTEPYYPFDSAKAGEYFAAAGCIKSDRSLTDSQGKALRYTVYCLSDGKDALSKVINSFVASLKSAGIELTVKCVSEEEYSSSLEKRSADMWCGPVYDSQSSDKYDYYHTGGKYNYSGVSDEMLDLELEELRVATDYSERCLKTALMLGNVMELAAELPLYQQKTIVVYNKSVIDENSIPLDSDPQGCRYIIRALQPAE